jgi:hypothetical protein
MTQKYTDNKNCWSPLSPDGQNNPLSSLPQLKSLFVEELVKRKFLEAFVGKCERELCDNLRNNVIPRYAHSRVQSVSEMCRHSIVLDCVV